ncbi:MAG: rRNA (cytidine1402-2-O)-methyltransferase [Actinomycetota bacterium]|nr:rRNA (cytidine1402-2-O)-methyltransferase [Actinomycetota bacterium]
MAGTLFVVGTPIGNLGDLTQRAAETLAGVDLVAAEDTRRSGRLLDGMGIRKPIISLFEGNERERTPELVARLRAGANIAVVTDGGMPSISDPGFRLVRACAKEGIEVRVVPGPSAAIAALVVSGMPTDRFVFEGFLPRKQGERERRLAELATDRRTIIVFESPLRVQILLRDVLVAFGDRQIVIARELTKLHEEAIRGSVSEVLSRLGDAELKGEVVVVLRGADEAVHDLAACIQEARELLAQGLKKRDAARAVADRHGVSANDIYAGLLVEPAPEAQVGLESPVE